MTNASHDAIRSDLIARAITLADEIARTYYDHDDLPFDDITETLELIPLNNPARSRIALSLELCPMHLCDEQICADDDISECAEMRA